ncbi:MAG: hypothetical protein ACRDTX_28930 [Pseudonocardiaceae bacterium]
MERASSLAGDRRVGDLRRGLPGGRHRGRYQSCQIKDFWIGEAGRAESIAATGGLTPPPVEQILITAPAGPLDLRSAEAAARDVAERIRPRRRCDLLLDRDQPGVSAWRAGVSGSRARSSPAPGWPLWRGRGMLAG